MSIVIQDKRDECDRVINNISSSLPAILSTQLHLQSLTSQDFSQLMKLIRDNYTQVHPHLLSEFNIDDINKCIKIRNILYHQNITSPQFLTNAISSLYKCQKAFGIQSALVPIRVLACKKCDTTITRSAQPTVVFKDTANINQRITRTYDVQSWVVANDNTEFATRENTWYPGWVRTYTYCAECRRHKVSCCESFECLLIRMPLPLNLQPNSRLRGGRQGQERCLRMRSPPKRRSSISGKESTPARSRVALTSGGGL